MVELGHSPPADGWSSRPNPPTACISSPWEGVLDGKSFWPSVLVFLRVVRLLGPEHARGSQQTCICTCTRPQAPTEHITGTV